MPDTGDTNPPVTKEIQQAHQALDDANKARDAGISDAAVINRIYAAFHAVRGVRYDRGFYPTSHGWVLSLFGSEIIAAGDAPRKDGRFLSQLSELRQQADYGYEEPNENVAALLSRTQQLVSERVALCPTTD